MATASTLSTRQLNRALLARQHLLRRSPMSAPAMIEHLVGMQAQVPLNPYYALWSRLEGFRPHSLGDLIQSRKAVRISFLRTTLHLVTARDAVALRPVVQDVLVRGYRSGSPFHKNLVRVDVDELMAAGRALLADEALTTAELGRRLAQRWPDRDPASLAYAVRYLVPLVQVPPRGVWGRTGAARWRTLERWLDQSLDGATQPDALVLRYLAAFGPATVADIATWSWLTRVRDVIDRLRPRLRVYTSEHGAELFDVEDGPMPDPDTPAPVRFLPHYDNVWLSHADRARITSPGYVERAVNRGSVLVDGFVHAAWRLVRSEDGTAIDVEPFAPLSATDRRGIEAEGQQVMTFATNGATTGEIRISANP